MGDTPPGYIGVEGTQRGRSEPPDGTCQGARPLGGARCERSPQVGRSARYDGRRRAGRWVVPGPSTRLPRPVGVKSGVRRAIHGTFSPGFQYDSGHKMAILRRVRFPSPPPVRAASCRCSCQLSAMALLAVQQTSGAIDAPQSSRSRSRGGGPYRWSCTHPRRLGDSSHAGGAQGGGYWEWVATMRVPDVRGPSRL